MVLDNNSLPCDKTLTQPKLKAYADEKNIYDPKMKFDLGRVENIVEKGENAGIQHFLLFPHCFQALSFPCSSKVGISKGLNQLLFG